MVFVACVTLALGTPPAPRHVDEMAPAASVSRIPAAGCVPAGLPPESLVYARMACQQIDRWVPRHVTFDPRPVAPSNENSVVRWYVPRLRRTAYRTRPRAAVGRGRSAHVVSQPVREQLIPPHARHAGAIGPHFVRRPSKSSVTTGRPAAHSASPTPKSQTLGPVVSGSATTLSGPAASQISPARVSTPAGKPLRLPLILIVLTLLGVPLLVFGLGCIPVLVRNPRPNPVPRPVRERLTHPFRDRRGRRRAISPTPDVVVANVAPAAGPTVVDVASAGGVIGVCGPGAVRAALDVLADSARHTVIITADCIQELYGGNGRPEHVAVARTLDEAIGLVHAESVERIRAEEDGRSRDAGRDVWLCARADAQQARLRALFERTVEHGVQAILLGYWPYGPSLTVDDDGRVLSASAEAGQPTGPYRTTLPLDVMQSEPSSGADVGQESPPGPLSLETDFAPAGVEDADERPQLMILGPERIKVGGIEFPEALERRFSWEVATYLACHPDGTTADVIIEELWPDEPLMSARKRFTDSVYHLRKALRTASGQPHGKFVSLRMNRYRLDETQVSVDLWEFESAILASRATASKWERLQLLRRATQLYRGDFVYVGDGLWAESFRHDLRRKVVGALDEAASLLEVGSPGMAITMLENAGGIMPWAEEADRHIMRIYQRLGRADDARTAYEALKERLGRLGEEPGAETRELLQAIVVGCPAG